MSAYLEISEVKLSLEQSEAELAKIIAKRLGLNQASFDFEIKRRSIDARKEDIYFVYKLAVYLKENAHARDQKTYQDILSGKQKQKQLQIKLEKKREVDKIMPNVIRSRPLIVGAGPAGLFACLVLAKAGLKPILIERGEKVEDRLVSVLKFWEQAKLNPESNVQFGEGGAGTFSDGKLTTRVKNPMISLVLESLHQAGADASILIDAKPHIGTDRLRLVLINLRKQLIELGASIFYGTKLEQITKAKLGYLVETNQGQLKCQDLVLAIGHSSRDSFLLLERLGFALQAKDFAIGFRLEQAQVEIDRLLYKKWQGHPRLGPASYNYACLTRINEEKRGVYSFCMCPGGLVIASSSEPGAIVTNGMSNQARSEENSNSAILTTVTSADFGKGHLAGIAFQREIERKAFLLAGSNYAVPVMRLGDFLAEQELSSLSQSSLKPSYKPAVVYRDLRQLFPRKITASLQAGLKILQKRQAGFAHNDCLLTAPETRTSSPVRIMRDAKTLEALGFPGIYPCGEGAGYAGGIVSSALDGIRVARAILKNCE